MQLVFVKRAKILNFVPVQMFNLSIRVFLFFAVGQHVWAQNINLNNE